MSVRSTVAVVATACVAVFGESRPVDAATVRWWTIRASQSAVLTVVLPRPTVLLLGEPGDGGPVVGISGAGGGAAGFFVTPARGGSSYGQVAVRGERYSLGRERETLPAGTYTVRVVAESASVVVRVPVLGASATWRAERPLRVQSAEATWDVPAGPVVVGGADVTLRSSSIALFALHYTASRASGEDVVCLTQPGGLCLPNEGQWAATATTGSTHPDVQAPGVFAAYADQVAAGRFTARWRVTSTGAVTAAAAFALVVG